MTYNNSFLKISAFSALLSAVTTFLLWLFPTLYSTPSNFDEAVLLYQNPYYIARLWTNLIHIPFALTAYFGLMFIVYKRQAAVSMFGMIWFIIWGAIELIGVSILLFSVNYNWRSSYPHADALQKITLKNNIETFSSIWDSMFFVLLIAFLVGTIFFAIATWRSNGIEKLLSYLLWASVPLTLLIILANYASQNWAAPLIEYVYPVLQPISRAVLGLLIWKNIGEKNYRQPHLCNF